MKVDGTTVPFNPANGRDFKLAELQDALRMEGNPNPFIQCVPLRDNELLICDDDGISKNLPPNLSATIYTQSQVLQMPGYGVVGNIAIIPKKMLK